MIELQDWQELENRIVSCRKCERLVIWREHIAKIRRKAYQDWQYWGKPVPGFGDRNARVLVVGLAPGAHGSNRTGRMFSGDASGDFLYRHLFAAGFSNKPAGRDRRDGLILKDIYISAICRCVPPSNKPSKDEKKNCLPYLENEISLLKNLSIIVTLGRVAYDGIMELYKIKTKPQFVHGEIVRLSNAGLWVVMSYHPSRQNTQTGRLTEDMFAGIWTRVNNLLTIK